jgi:serine protease
MTATRARFAAIAGVCLLAPLYWISGAPILAQQQPAPRFLMTPAQLEAIETAAARALPYIPGEVIVKFRTGVTVAQQSRALSALRSRPEPARLQWIGQRIARLATPDDQDPVAASANLTRQPEVEYAHPNWLLKKKAVPNDTQYASRQWNFSLLDLPRAWDINAGGGGITVAVIDTGLTEVTATFPFRTWNGTAIVVAQMPFGISTDMDASRLTDAQDFVFWTGPVFDMDGHGTHVAGTVAQATNNNLGFAGVAYNAKIMPLKVCFGFWEVQIVRAESGIPGYPPLNVGGCPTSAVVQAINHAADNGAKVINLSLGGTNPSPSYLDALNYAVSKGVFVAMAAGNEFEEGNPTTYPASYGPEVAGAMAVGAVGQSSQRSFYSSTGSYVEIAAPGGDTRSGGSLGAIFQTGIFFSDYNPAVVIFPRFDRYGDIGYQGTSMSSPHVAGMAALLMSQGVTRPSAVEALIKATAKDLGSAGPDNDFGAGLIQPRAALRGFGLVR